MSKCSVVSVFDALPSSETRWSSFSEAAIGIPQKTDKVMRPRQQEMRREQNLHAFQALDDDRRDGGNATSAVDA